MTRQHEGFLSGKKQRIRFARILTSAAVTVAIGFGYIAADAYDVLPGVLTIKNTSNSSLLSASTSNLDAESVQGVDEAVDEGTATLVSGSPIVTKSKETSDVDSSAAQALIDQVLTASGVGTDVSAVVAKPDGTIIAQTNIDTAREPASTLKTLTAFAAVTQLDMGSTLDTQVYMKTDSSSGSGSSDGSKSATLLVKGNGDVLLGAGENDESHVTGRAGLKTLAERTATALKKKGVSSVKITYDDSLYGGAGLPSEIAINNTNYTNEMIPASMAVDEARQWTQTYSDPDAENGYPTRSETPAVDAVSTFASALSEQGISVTGDFSAQTLSSVKSDYALAASVSSAPLSEVLKIMLQNSDNTLAEMFGRLVSLARGGDGSTSAGAQAVTAVLKEQGITTAGISLADSSGLTPNSVVTVRTLVEVQSAFLTSKKAGYAAAEEGMPVLGLTGTLRNRSVDTSTYGLVRAKTGTLDTTSSLAGNVSRSSGGQLIFAIIANNTQVYSAASAINTFAVGLLTL